MTTWDVTLIEAPAPVVSAATWDVTLRTDAWTYFTVSGTAIQSASGYMLLDSDQTGYTLRASNPQPRTLLSSGNQTGWTLKTGNDQTGYTLEA